MSRLAFALVLALAGAARAQAPTPPPAAPALELTLKAEQAQVQVAGTIELTVTLRNAGKDPVEAVGAEARDGKTTLFEDRAIVSLDVQLDDGKVFKVERIHPGPSNPRSDWPKASLAAGAAAELRLALPALAKGKWRVVAHYRRGPVGSLQSAPLEVEVGATPEGSTEAEVVMITEAGPMRIRLFARDALGTALNFARLITTGADADGKRRAPFYDGLVFHRVIPGFMIQGGCPRQDGTGGPGYTIPAEIPDKRPVPEALAHQPGRLSMARTDDPDSAGCQFFICVGTPTMLDGKYTVFGEVTRGLDVAYTIADGETTAMPGSPQEEKSKPVSPIHIRTVRLVAGPAGK